MCFRTRPQRRSARFYKNAPSLSYARRRFAIRRGGSLSTGTAPITALREDLDLRINQREKQMRQHREADRLSLYFFSRFDRAETATEL
jgi:hypothetical protein